MKTMTQRTNSRGRFQATHGMSHTRLYVTWCAMKSRCLLPSTKHYRYYGGRGIKVCAEWLRSFEPFRDWAKSSGYHPSLELDRVDSNGNYEPGNCRWANRIQQGHNTRKRAGTSQFKGVSLTTKTNKWRAQIKCGDESLHLGYFFSEQQAARAYDAKARELYGTFATTNFKEES